MWKLTLGCVTLSIMGSILLFLLHGCGDLDFGMPNDALIEAIALLQLLKHGILFLARGIPEHDLVLLMAERLAFCFNGHKAHGLQDIRQLPENQLNALLIACLVSCVLLGKLNGINHRQQPFYDVCCSILPDKLLLFLGTFLIVLKLCLESLEGINEVCIPLR